LLIDVGQLFDGELVLIRANLLLAQEAQEAKLMLEEEGQCTTATFRATTSSADSVDIIVRIIGRVKLDNPVNLGEIKTTLSDVRAEEDARLGLTEFEIGRCALLLFLFSMDILRWDVNVVE